jgi:arabinofuranosyltransferase
MLPPLVAAPLRPSGCGPDVDGVTATSNTRFILLTGLVVVFTYVFLANSWVGDDAYISFRVVDNFVHGYGLRWNPAERVQAFSNPLWVLVMSACYLVTSDVFFTSLALSYACCLACLYLAITFLRRARAVGLFVVLLLSSKAFVDYTSSGLESPLSYLLLAVFYFKLLADFRTGSHLAPRSVFISFMVASLAFVNRADSLILYLPALAYLGYRYVGSAGPRAILRLLGAASPAVAWLLFSLVYYGFPFPNPYYAKVAIGIPTWIQAQQGIAYLLNSIHFDPATIGLIVLGLLLALRQRQVVYLLYACAVVANLAYVIWVGGDFMSGRFFTLAFLASVIVIVTILRTAQETWLLLGFLAFYNIVNPLAPVKTTAAYTMAWPWRTQNGVKDERGGFHADTNVLFFAPFRNAPDSVWAREGMSLRDSPSDVVVRGEVGLLGFFGGPQKYIIDYNGLTDPFTARLPIDESVYFDFNVSHFFRAIPAGYVESRQTKSNRLEDPALRDYFDVLSDVTSGPVFTWGRMKNIFALNLGRYRNFQDVVRERRRVDVLVPATSPRFASHVGDRDVEHRRIVATGDEGYLQLGPAIPMRAGAYRVEWIGTYPEAAPSELGFVHVCYNGCTTTVKKPPVSKESGNPAGRILAAVEFNLGQDVRDLEYRLYVMEGSGVVLEQVRLTQLR